MGLGVMSQIAVAKEAAIKFPMGHSIGNWWASAENDVQLAGPGADRHLGAAFHAPGAVCPVHDAVFRYVYNAGKASSPDFRQRV
jgi:branched-chain amino acid transport system substrate-binding protein